MNYHAEKARADRLAEENERLRAEIERPVIGALRVVAWAAWGLCLLAWVLAARAVR